MTSRCICYAVNQGFLFPAVASALQLRKILPESSADILVFGIDIRDTTQRDFSEICASNNIILKSLTPEILEGYSGLYANLFLDRFVPDTYSRIIYVDADVQFWGPVTELVETTVPKGQFHAAADPMVFELDKPSQRSRALKAYMDGLGLGGEKGRTYLGSPHDLYKTAR